MRVDKAKTEYRYGALDSNPLDPVDDVVSRWSYTDLAIEHTATTVAIDPLGNHTTTVVDYGQRTTTVVDYGQRTATITSADDSQAVTQTDGFGQIVASTQKMSLALELTPAR